MVNLILCGGSGTRLWPLSRQGTPKQLLRLIDGMSLLRIAFERLGDLVPPERVLVCTGAAYADQVAAELPELPAGNILGGDISGNVLLGYKIEKGEIVGRVKDTMIAGNIYRILKDIAAMGSESEWVSSLLSTPPIYCTGVSVSSGG